MESFEPTRGIREGDPLSPYLFILCMKYLGHLIEQKCVDGDWVPLKASMDNLGFSHLLSADDIILFSKVDRRACDTMMEVLEKFCYKFGQKISQDKSWVYFSPNVNDELKDEVCERLITLGSILVFPFGIEGSLEIHIISS